MNRISDAFSGKKAFIAYLMAGDPSLAASAEYILAAQAAGASLIEIGIPFSDPIAEGETIQAASERALSAGTRLDGIFDMVGSISGKMDVPIVFMTYYNPVFVYGIDRFCATCSEIGICGLIIPDLPFEEQAEAKQIAQTYGIDIVSLIAPTSKERIKEIAENAQGFVYLVSSMGVTGARSQISSGLESFVDEIKKHTQAPVAVGFGISNAAQVAEYAKFADGVIVGSAIVDIIAKGKFEAKEKLQEYIKSMSEPLRR
ncbi:MAG: tryptophan synthase subunit alpha [Eubacteriaceae bacterium]|nr:tryptophan synthase subunit alpha [Eubacteriaceae bacterium]